MITETTIEVRYPECDAMGIVHHAVYPVWYEIARMDFFKKIGFSYSEMSSQGINPPMVNLNLQYRSPVRYPGKVTVRTACSISGGKKLELKYAVYIEGSSKPAATATSFHIWTGPDMKSLDMQSLPSVNERLLKARASLGVLIMAGGKSSRMGKDKATLTIGTGTMIDNAIAFWKARLPDANVYVACGSTSHYLDLPNDVISIPDIELECGPIGGLHAAFHTTNEDFLVVSAVDMPLLTATAFESLTEKFTYCEDACVFEVDGRPEPLFGYYSRSCIHQIDQMIKQKDYRLANLLANCKVSYVKQPAGNFLMNTNTPEDFQKAVELLSKQ